MERFFNFLSRVLGKQNDTVHHIAVEPSVQVVRYTTPVRLGTRLRFRAGADYIFTFGLAGQVSPTSTLAREVLPATG